MLPGYPPGFFYVSYLTYLCLIMAKQKIDSAAELSKQLVAEVEQGQFRPVYLLMGEEPYYPDMVCDAIVRNCIPEEEKDFNETICYGSDVTADMVLGAARRYPMMAERQLVVVKEAHRMNDLEDLAYYCEQPLDSTVLVILMHRAKADKRRQLYKSVSKIGVVVDSAPLRDYQMSGWIMDYYKGRGLTIDPRAAQLLAESAGTDLGTIAVETEKMLKNIPEGCKEIKVEDVERNVGISRQFSVFELNSAFSERDAARAVRIARHVGSAARFNMAPAVAALYGHFMRLLKLSALYSQKGYLSPDDKARVLPGMNPYFHREYENAMKKWSMYSLMKVISILCEYDYRGKGGDGGDIDQGELLNELTLRILNA